MILGVTRRKQSLQCRTFDAKHLSIHNTSIAFIFLGLVFVHFSLRANTQKIFHTTDMITMPVCK